MRAKTRGLLSHMANVGAVGRQHYGWHGQSRCCNGGAVIGWSPEPSSGTVGAPRRAKGHLSWPTCTKPPCCADLSWSLTKVSATSSVLRRCRSRRSRSSRDTWCDGSSSRAVCCERPKSMGSAWAHKDGTAGAQHQHDVCQWQPTGMSSRDYNQRCYGVGAK